jgi:Fic family protein
VKIPVTPPPTADLMRSAGGGQPLAIIKHFLNLLQRPIGPTVNGKYRHWDALRHLEPPAGYTSELWWLGIKTARAMLSQRLPLTDQAGAPFQLVVPDTAHQMLHAIDRDASGTIQISAQVTNPHTRDTYLYKSVLEEAIRSSQLEGASTTHEVAKDMIKRGRPPRTRSEQMIFNNYQALLFLRRVVNESLTPDMVFEVHRLLTDKTLDDPDAAGRLRRPDEHIHVSDEIGTVLHNPPPAGQLEQRMRALCAFANASESTPFIHPVVRSILLHLWLAYDHPFIDGNGRTARALFYWSMAKRGYWLTEFLSISRIIKEAPGKYNRSFLYTETDDNDATYFVLAQLQIIVRAIHQLHEYLARKAAELDATAILLRQSKVIKDQLNHRQLAIVNHALKHPHVEYTFASHANSHNVTYATGRSDLLELEEHGLLVSRKIGKTFTFNVPPNLNQRLSTLVRRRAGAALEKPSKKRRRP